MASEITLTTPILVSPISFDATKAQEFTFAVPSGGGQVLGSELVIMDENSAVVKRQSTTSYQYKVVLPANSLTNGNKYYAKLKTVNGDVSSSDSNVINFSCYITPTISPESPSSYPANLTNNSYNFIIKYAGGEKLSIYTFNLYDNNSVKLATSGSIYTMAESDTYQSSSSNDYNMSYTFTGLSNTQESEIYWIEVVYTTNSGYVGTYGSNTTTKFTVNYERPTYFSILELNSNCSGGYIEINNNMVNIDGYGNPSSLAPSGGKIDLTTAGNTVYYPEGYSIDGDFSLGIWGSNYVNDDNGWNIIVLNSGEENIIAKFRTIDNNGLKAYVELFVVNEDNSNIYSIYSNQISYTQSEQSTEFLTLIKKIGNLYDIELITGGE